MLFSPDDAWVHTRPEHKVEDEPIPPEDRMFRGPAQRPRFFCPYVWETLRLHPGGYAPLPESKGLNIPDVEFDPPLRPTASVALPFEKPVESSAVFMPLTRESFEPDPHPQREFIQYTPLVKESFERVPKPGPRYFRFGGVLITR
jgi:hypothetical protein